MANSNEEQPKKVNELNKPSVNKEKVKLSSFNHGKLSFYLSTLASIMAVAAIASAFYATYLSHQLNHLNKKQNASLHHLEQQQIKTINNLQDTINAIDQTQKLVKDQIQENRKKIQALLQQNRYQEQDWLLLKARYLLELAQINAHWSNDQQTTIALLQQADFLLAPVADQTSFTIRQAIAKEITEAEALPKIDTAGILSQLDAMQDIIDSLTFRKPFNATFPKNSHETSSDNSWGKTFQNSLSILEKLVIIRHHDETIKPLASPLHQSLLRDSIRLNVQEAQWAVLQNNETIFQMALAQMLKKIATAFDENDPPTQNLVKQIQQLQRQKLITKKPLISHSLDLLNQWIEVKKNQKVDKPVIQGGGTNL